MAQPEVEIELVIGEDFACQIFWTDEYGEPVPVSDPVLMDVKDGNGQIAMRFTGNTDAASQPKININGYIGFFQLTAPKSVTTTLVPGRYRFDLFAAVADSAAPFARQAQQVIAGYISAFPRISVVESAPELHSAQGDVA